MQTLNSQRKAFLDMVAWSEGTDNGRQKTRNHGYDVIVGGELFTDYSDHPRKLVTLNPKLKSTAAGRYQLLSRWWDAYRKQLGLKDFSPESQDAVALQQIKERGALAVLIPVPHSCVVMTAAPILSLILIPGKLKLSLREALMWLPLWLIFLRK